MSKLGLGCLLLGIMALSPGGCPRPQEQDNTGGNNGPADQATLQVNFSPDGGNFAVASDTDGNQYSFRAHESGGDTIVTEANIKTPRGKELKVSLDDQGRPVNVRVSDNTAADLVYTGADLVKVRLTDRTGAETASAADIKTNTMKAAVQQRRLENFSKAAARFADKSAQLDTLQKGLETCEEVVASITDPDSNPDSPLADSSLGADLRKIGDVASTATVEELANREDLPDVTIDQVPDAIQMLAGQTYILFDAEGFCLEFTDISNRLTFDANGVLMTEFDRRLVFPDLNVNAGSARTDPGITINYETLTELNLTPDDIGFDLKVQPVFTGTQLDENGNITIERRFNADLTFPVELWGTTTAEAHKLFDVAFLNGTLSDDAVLLEMDLVLVDLEEETPVATLGQLRYYQQGSRQPERIYTCESGVPDQGDEPLTSLTCPPGAAVGEEVEVAFDAGSADTTSLQFDWFVSSGPGYIGGDATAQSTTVVGTEAGFVEVTLLVHDMSAAPDVVDVYTCTINVGQDEPTPPPDLDGYCPTTMVLYEPADAWVEGALLPNLAVMEWFVIGTWAYDISDPFAPRTQVTFYETGTFQVAFETWTVDGDYYFLWQDVEVVESGSVDYGDNQPPPADVTDYIGNYDGSLSDPPPWEHQISFSIDEIGDLTGWTAWNGGASFALWGYVTGDGYIYFEDDAADWALPVGIYQGQWDTTSAGVQGFIGTYYEDDMANAIGYWEVVPTGGA